MRQLERATVDAHARGDTWTAWWPTVAEQVRDVEPYEPEEFGAVAWGCWRRGGIVAPVGGVELLTGGIRRPLCRLAKKMATSITKGGVDELEHKNAWSASG